MFKRYWVRATASVALAAIALFFWSAGIWWISQQQAQHSNYAKHASSYSTDDATKDIKERCLALVGANKQFECIVSVADSERAYRQSSDDLKAQQDMALWATVVGIMAVAQVALGAGGTWFLVSTFMVGQEANRIALDTAKAQTRAYLSFKTGSFGISEYDYGLIRIVIENVGNSPALDVKVTGGFVHHTVPENLYEFRENYTGPIPPGGRKVIQLANFDSVGAIAGYPNSLPLEKKIAVIVRFSGQDVFGDDIKFSLFLEERQGLLTPELNFSLEDHGEIIRGGLLDYSD